MGNPALNTWAFLIYKPLYRCWVFWVQGAGRCRIWRKPFSGLHFLIFSWLRKKANEPCIPSCHMTVWGQTESCRQVSSSSIFHLHFLDTFLPELPELTDSAGLAGHRVWEDLLPLPLPPPCWDARYVLTLQPFHINTEDSNSDLEGYTASTLPTKRYP